MRRKTILLVFCALFLVIGFAAVTTSLYINGTATVKANDDDFRVYYSDAYLNYEEDLSMIKSDTELEFYVTLQGIGEYAIIEYEVTNGSKSYDADLNMTCVESSEYIEVYNEFDDETILKASKKRMGYLDVTMTKSYVGDDLEVPIKCTIVADAVEKDLSDVVVLKDAQAFCEKNDFLYGINYVSPYKIVDSSDYPEENPYYICANDEDFIEASYYSESEEFIFQTYEPTSFCNNQGYTYGQLYPNFSYSYSGAYYLCSNRVFESDIDYQKVYTITGGTYNGPNFG